MDRKDVFKFIAVFVFLVIVFSIGVYVHYLYFFFNIWLAPTIFWVIIFSALIAYSAVNDYI